jgi:hypothetical protein
MSPAPVWNPSMLSALAGPHKATWRVSAHGEGLPAAGLVLNVARLQLSFDEARVPRVELRVDVALPADPAYDAVLDPRAAIRLHVHAGHVIAGVDDRVLVADLGLRARGTEQPVSTLELTAMSDEALVIDNSPSSQLTGLVANSGRGQIQVLLNNALGAPAIYLDPAVPSTTSYAYPAGTVGDKWTMIEDAADGIGDVDVYDDGYRTFVITMRPTLAAAGSEDLSLVEGVGGTVISRSSSVDRENDWANRVLLVYKWTDAGVSNVVQSVRSVTTGPFAATTGNVKCWEETRSVPATQTRADAAASSLLKRKASRGRNLSVRAIAVPWLRPGMTVKLTTRTGSARHLVAAVTFDGTGWMDFDTRYPDSTETIGP